MVRSGLKSYSKQFSEYYEHRYIFLLLYRYYISVLLTSCQCMKVVMFNTDSTTSCADVPDLDLSWSCALSASPLALYSKRLQGVIGCSVFRVFCVTRLALTNLQYRYPSVRSCPGLGRSVPTKHRII